MKLKDIIIGAAGALLIREMYKGSSCPAATKSIDINTDNRNDAIENPRIQYGPLNLSDNQYWQRLAKHWKTSVDVAKNSRCENCVAFDISPRMLNCIDAGPVSAEDDEIGAGMLGYCHMHHFKCHSARTCYTWAAGGPIIDDKVSKKWQQKTG